MADRALTTRPPRWTTSAGGIEKAAILLMTLGPEAAANILKHLSDPEVRQLSEAMTRLRSIRREHAAAVHEEAWRWLTNREGFLVDGEQFVHKLLESRAAAGAKGETQMMRELRARKGGEQTLADSLEPVSSQVIAQVVGGEHPQVVAFILANLHPKQAGEILAALPDEQRPDIVQRIAELTTVSDELLAEVGAVLEGQVKGLGSVAQGTALGGTKLAADILNTIDKTIEGQIFSQLEEAAPELAENIRNLMLTFEDLGRLDNRGMQTLLKELPREDLLLCLKTASPLMKEKIFGNMSARAVEILQDDLGSMGPVRLKEVEKAQSSIVAVARRLADEQKINLGGGGDDAVV
jgi:flagellar motor switch protein FliG